ncbi:MAG TPA: ABC transporter ATP-binding protein [Pedococcus sp.]
MIEFHDVAVAYAAESGGRDGATGHVVLSGASFTVPEGELVLVVGPTGSGKSTLLRCVNGLVPHFSGGTLHGRVVVDGRDTRDHRPRDLADLVGFVVQDPVSSFVTDTVEEEIAYGMEAMGVPAAAMRRRVEETLDLLGLADVRQRPLRDLSGGQQQRVAIGAVRWPPRTCWPRCTASSTTSGSRCWWPSTASSGSSTTPTTWCCSAAAVSRACSSRPTRCSTPPSTRR